MRTHDPNVRAAEEQRKVIDANSNLPLLPPTRNNPYADRRDFAAETLTTTCTVSSILHDLRLDIKVMPARIRIINTLRNAGSHETSYVAVTQQTLQYFLQLDTPRGT